MKRTILFLILFLAANKSAFALTQSQTIEEANLFTADFSAIESIAKYDITNAAYNVESSNDSIIYYDVLDGDSMDLYLHSAPKVHLTYYRSMSGSPDAKKAKCWRINLNTGTQEGYVRAEGKDRSITIREVAVGTLVQLEIANKDDKSFTFDDDRLTARGAVRIGEFTQIENSKCIKVLYKTTATTAEIKERLYGFILKKVTVIDDPNSLIEVIPKEGETTEAIFYSPDSMQLILHTNYGFHFNTWSDIKNEATTKDSILTFSVSRLMGIANSKGFASYILAKALFEKNTYSISYSVNNAQYGYIEGPHQAQYLEEVEMKAIPLNGYKFDSWTDGVLSASRKEKITRDSSYAANFILMKDGQCGSNLYWRFKDETLTISGSGDMYDYTAHTVPWEPLRDSIKRIEFASEMTSIGAYAFAYINNRSFNALYLPQGITRIGQNAFENASFLENIEFDESLDAIGADAFKNCSRVLTMTCWSMVAPSVESGALTSISSEAELYVLSAVLRKYQIDNNWNRFLLKEIGATETTMDVNDVTVEPSNNTALFTWPTNVNAATYTITITKEGEVFCTLVFNANGQLTGIAFAPSRNGSNLAPEAVLSNGGMQFTVTGLDIATRYDFSLKTQDETSHVLAEYTGSFGTTGAAEGLYDLQSDQVQNTKILHDGQIFILRGDKVYTITGQEIIVP